MTKKWIVLGVLAVSLLLSSVAVANGALSVNWWVIGGGGGSATVGNTSLSGVIGQWMVGSHTVGTTQLGSGFWGGGAIGESKVFLPLAIREA